MYIYTYIYQKKEIKRPSRRSKRPEFNRKIVHNAFDPKWLEQRPVFCSNRAEAKISQKTTLLQARIPPKRSRD